MPACMSQLAHSNKTFEASYEFCDEKTYNIFSFSSEKRNEKAEETYRAR